jgi:hypothetical protein
VNANVLATVEDFPGDSDLLGGWFGKRPRATLRPGEGYTVRYVTLDNRTSAPYGRQAEAPPRVGRRMRRSRLARTREAAVDPAVALGELSVEVFGAEHHLECAAATHQACEALRCAPAWKLAKCAHRTSQCKELKMTAELRKQKHPAR